MWNQDIRQPRNDPWSARAQKREGRAQARTMTITTIGVEWVAAFKPLAYRPRTERIAPKVATMKSFPFPQQ